MCPQVEIRSIEKPGSGWYALHTRHQQESSVGASLSQKGFETFLPLYTSTHRWTDRTKQISLPLFPCYVFVRGNFVGQELPILATPGVYAFVRHAGRATVIPDAEIGCLKRIVESSLRFEPHPFLKYGDRVRIKSGPLTGLEGVLHRRKNLYRVVLSVELLQKSVAVEVDAYTVEGVAKQNGVRLARDDQQTNNAFDGAYLDG